MRIAWTGLAALFLALFAWSLQPAVEPAQAAPSGKVITVDISMEDFYFEPGNFSATAGDTIVFNMRNNGAFPHHLHIGGQGIDVQSPTLRSGETATWAVTFPRPGLYAIYCNIAAGTPNHHRLLGSEGTVSVGATSDGTPLAPLRIPVTGVAGSGIRGEALVQPRADGATSVAVTASGLTAGTVYMLAAHDSSSRACSGGNLPVTGGAPVLINRTSATMGWVVSAPANRIAAVSLLAGGNNGQLAACGDPRPQLAPGASITLTFQPGRDGVQPGTVTLTDQGNQTQVTIRVQARAAGVAQPAHIHEGACPGVGAVRFPLSSVVDGVSVSTVNTRLADILNGGYSINIHESVQQASRYTACVNLPAGGARPAAPAALPRTGDDATPLLALLASLAAASLGAGLAIRRVYAR